MSKLFSKSKNYSKQITGQELQDSHQHSVNLESQEENPQHIENLEEQNKDEHSADLQKQHSDRLGKQNREDINEINDKSENSPLWSMSFDGSCSKTGAGAGIWVHNTENNHAEGHSYRLNFQCTNNIAEYEALLLGLHLLKKLGTKRITVHGDS